MSQSAALLGRSGRDEYIPEHLGTHTRNGKHRACDICRRKKVRCDILVTEKSRCSNCIAFNEDCTFMQPPPKKHSPLYPKGYVERLEDRISRVERLLKKVKPDVVIPNELNEDLLEESWVSKNDMSEEEESGFSYLAPPALTSAPSNSNDDPYSCDNAISQGLTRTLAYLSTDLESGFLRFFGESSPFNILKNASDMREYVGLPSFDLTSAARRMEPRLLESDARSHEQQFSFPSSELTNSLVELYFTFYNSYLPVLHRQSFLQALKTNLHLSERGFGTVVLLVCALGSKVSDDPRVLLDSASAEDGWHSGGWKWFRQVDLESSALQSTTSLYGIQVLCLSAIYLKNSSSPDSSHICTGLGLRLAQDIGAHRQQVYKSMTRGEGELMKRVFWVLVLLDWSYSSSVGRPSGIHREDIDLEMPLECDDEYWSCLDPRVAFRQPPGVPSNVTFFNCLLRLSQIHAFAYRTLYSSPKARASMKTMNPEWEQRVVSELDAALLDWFHEVPVHLRWDPHNPSLIFLSQSATLYASYYSLQIAIHRPFIPFPLTSQDPLATSSLAICTTAANACVTILDKLSRRTAPLLATVICDNLMSLFVAGIVLLIGIWREKEMCRADANTEEGIAEVRQIMQILRAVESRWHSAGRIWDMLHAVATAGEISMSPTLEDHSPGRQDLIMEEIWLKTRSSGRRLGGRSLIYHHPIVSGIAAVDHASPLSPSYLSLGESPTAYHLT